MTPSETGAKADAKRPDNAQTASGGGSREDARKDDRSNDDRPKGGGRKDDPPKNDGRDDPKPTRPRRPIRFDLCRTPPATPYLVIRSFGEDLGVRPVPPEDAGGLSYSPDIPMIPEVTPDGRIILQCWITNIGMGPAAPVQIEFFLLPPSITQPGPDPVLVATEYAIISPHMSRLIRTPPLSFLNPFAGGLAQGVMVRCSTPFDRHAGGLEPGADRHVAMMNAWPIIDQAPDLSLGLSNLAPRPTTARVDVLVHRIRLRAGAQTTRPVRARFAGHDVLTLGERAIEVARHLDAAGGRKERQRKVFRQILKGLRPDAFSTALVQTSAAASQVSIDVSVADEARKVFPTAEFIRRQHGCVAASGRDCDLPPGRQTLVEGIALGAFEERSLRLKIAPTTALRDDECLAVHLFHLDEAQNEFRGRACLVIGRSLRGLRPTGLAPISDVKGSQ